MAPIYEVNLLIDEDICEPYMAWLKPHMQEMLSIDGFCSAQLCDAVHLPTDKAVLSGQTEGRSVLRVGVTCALAGLL